MQEINFIHKTRLYDGELKVGTRAIFVLGKWHKLPANMLIRPFKILAIYNDGWVKVKAQ